LLAEQARIALDNTEIRAPFDGIFVDRLVEVGDYVMMGDTIAIVSDDDPGLVVADVTELERNNLRIGGKATAHLVTGKIITGQIRFISVTADPVTHTFEVEVEVPNPQRDMPAGVTAELHIPVETILAHEVSAALLSLNDEGILGVKAVNAKNQVVFYPAQLADATTKGIWLTGLPNQLQFITVGQGFVRAGDTVQPVAER
jgi:multidrug efflux system membrane fusion protein